MQAAFYHQLSDLLLMYFHITTESIISHYCCTSGDGMGIETILVGMGEDGMEVLRGWMDMEVKLYSDG